MEILFAASKWQVVDGQCTQKWNANFYDLQRVSHKGNKEYKANNAMINYSLLTLYSLFPLCETSRKS